MNKNISHSLKVFAASGLASICIFSMQVADVYADAWWGNGYRSPTWVLANGGSIIRVKIQGGDSDEFKAFMTQGGKYVEVEFGNNMVFDDAKNGTYVITMYDCNRDCAYQERDDKTKKRGNDSQKASITIAARPGETTYLTYNVGSQTLTRTGGGAVVAAKPQLTREQIVERDASALKGQTCDTQKVHAIATDIFTFPERATVMHVDADPQQTKLAI